MELTREKAIEISIELWTWLAKTGGEKGAWDGWEHNGGRYENVQADCFLCEYGERQWRILPMDERWKKENCDFCPYYRKFGSCVRTKASYGRWDMVVKQETKKKYAALFLEQLRQL